MNEPRLIELIKRHEGLRTTLYIDTVGKYTIGYGRNLSDCGISKDEAEFLLKKDIERSVCDLTHNFPWFVTLNEVRQSVLVDMVFNLGITRLLGFVNTLEAMRTGQWEQAAKGMLTSKWAGQVGGRAIELARMMRTGRWNN